MRLALLLGFVLAAGVSAALTAALIPMLRRAQVLDVPVGRSLHERPTPRGGGLAIVLAVFLVMGAAPLVTWRMQGLEHLSSRFDVIMLGTTTILAFALVGLTEDLFSLPERARFALQLFLGLLLGLGAAAETGHSLVLSIAVAVCSAALVNVTNFMDGANGLAAGHGVITGLWYVAVSLLSPVPGLGFVMITVAGACAGFLPFNAPRARVFLGDSGSYALGGAWAFAATISLAEHVPADAAIAPLLILVTDTAYTLWMRIRAGQRWYEPHKLHIYQRLVSAGWPHWASALLVSGEAALCCALAVPDLLGHRTTPVIIGMAVILAAYLRMPVLVHAPNPFHRSRGLR